MNIADPCTPFTLAITSGNCIAHMVDTACVESKAVFIEHSAHTRILTRMVLAALLGGVLGYERENQGKAAGESVPTCWCRSKPA